MRAVMIMKSSGQETRAWIMDNQKMGIKDSETPMPMIYGVPDPQKVCDHFDHFLGNQCHQVQSLSEKQSCQLSLPI